MVCDDLLLDHGKDPERSLTIPVRGVLAELQRDQVSSGCVLPSQPSTFAGPSGRWRGLTCRSSGGNM